MQRGERRTAEIHMRVTTEQKATLERWATKLHYETLTAFLLAAAKLHKEQGR